VKVKGDCVTISILVKVTMQPPLSQRKYPNLVGVGE